MSESSIDAYDNVLRVAAYDADMDVMHPNRAKMVDILVSFLPFQSDATLSFLELGVGTGFLTRDILEAYSFARIDGVDGAVSMLQLAKSRLGPLADRVDLHVGDFRNLDGMFSDDLKYDAVISAYALHHLDRREKQIVLEWCWAALKPGGWLLNADLIIAENADVEHRIQQLRVAGIVERATPSDDRFADADTTRRCLDELEALEHDQPLSLSTDLETLKHAGFVDAGLVWLEHREAVFVARKPVDA